MHNNPPELRSVSGSTKRIRVVNKDTAQEELKKLKETARSGENGSTKPIFCSYEVAWAMMFVQGDLDGGTVKFVYAPNETGPFFDYFGEEAASSQGRYGRNGITTAGAYIFDRLMGNTYGKIVWEGCGPNADFFASITNQMV